MMLYRLNKFSRSVCHEYNLAGHLHQQPEEAHAGAHRRWKHVCTFSCIVSRMCCVCVHVSYIGVYSSIYMGMQLRQGSSMVPGGSWMGSWID